MPMLIDIPAAQGIIKEACTRLDLWSPAVGDLILGTGASTPMKVQSVVVWQPSAAGNLHN